MPDRIYLDLWGKPHVFTEGMFTGRRDSARGIVRNERGEYLFIRTTFRKLLIFPGGAIERGESDIEALIRETLEETGYQVEPIDGEVFADAIGKFYLNDTFFESSNRHYLVRISSNKVLPISDEECEVEEIVWKRLEDLRPEDYYEFMEPVIQKLRTI